MTFKELKPYCDAYTQKQKNEYEKMNYNAWLIGAYTRLSINSSVLGNNSMFTKQVNEYPKKPFGIEEHKQLLSEEESEALAVFQAKAFISQLESLGLPQAPK